MVSRTIPSWTLIGLIRAFLDLALAYFLLCGSTLGFFAWKFYNVFGLFLPCPCSGFFGYQNRNLCWHKLLIQWPRKKIHSVQKLALNRFPFILVWFNDQEWNSNANSIKDGRFGNGIIELEGDACSSSTLGLRLQTTVDKESGYDAKGKKIINLKQKSGIRRRRRAAFGYGKSSPVLFSGNFSPAVAGVSCSSYINGGETRSEISENLGPATEIEDSFPDDKNTQTGTNMDEATWHGFELSNGEGKGSTFIKKSTCNTNEKLGFTGDEANRIRMLEQALEEEKATHAALYLELEKERAAAASAADEAMAMILRLQEDKASIEMEARQYQRMIEEKFAYDEEEMNILKEILVRREKENHLLEKEVEAYRLMNTLGDEQECDFSYTLSTGGERPSVSLHLDEDPLLMVKQVGNSGSTGKKEVGKGCSWPSKNKTPSSGKRSHTAAVYLAGKVEGQDDDAIACQAIATKTAQNFGGIEKTSLTREELERNVEFGEPLGSNLHDSTFDMEPAIYDVHVVDDKMDILKEENKKESKLPTGSALDHENLLYDSGRSSSAVSNERLGIDAEIECLRERLRIVRGEKEKLTFSADQRKRVDTHLKLIEELVDQLKEFQQLKDPVRQNSLPPLSSSSKVSSDRRRCRSASDEFCDSA
ncbi:uncharacterized protein LOC111305406 isoform X1 [Durio zibethinus]|uniref:Uncharacterized protein LOC111305406 isoform X1 n=1 Tax=Durio zibethinus TaxID=66656 RepID=A0A6P6A1K3_DURZI|nr:uncharacterized protein LOC111305406 isoform X1 [Durio zibethinus]